MMYLPIYLFDIDGTLADNDHREHYLTVPEGQPKDWKSFWNAQPQDTVHEAIATIARLLTDAGGYRVILLTGRPETYRRVTETWLDKWNIPYEKMIMRPEGNREDDTTLKLKLIKEYFTPGECNQIKLIFEDRQRCVDSMRAAGYKVCQPQTGDF